MSRPCSVCAKSALAKFVDGSPDLSAAALSRQAEQIGMDLSADRILNHRAHRAPLEDLKPAKTKRDFAILVRDKAAEQFELGALSLTDKEMVPGISAGLKAQAVIDKREQVAKKQSGEDVLLALLDALRGGRRPEPVLLEDPTIIEGTFTE